VVIFLLNIEHIFVYNGNKRSIWGDLMKDWREELQSRPVPQKQVKSPHLCNCMAAMKGKWLDGIYTCIKCNKPVYDNMIQESKR